MLGVVLGIDTVTSDHTDAGAEMPAPGLRQGSAPLCLAPETPSSRGGGCFISDHSSRESQGHGSSHHLPSCSGSRQQLGDRNRNRRPFTAGSVC